VQQEATPPPESLQHGTTRYTASESHVHTPEPSWEQKPVAVLALELTWPDDSGVEFPRYDLWTERARWEVAIRDKGSAFGGVLIEHTASRLVWVFGVLQALEQLPQRAVHSALAIRQMVMDASAPELPPCPAVHLAVHLGAVRVDHDGADPAAHMLTVGETLTLPVVEGHCLAYGSGIPYLPVLDLLRDYCGITADDRPETLRTKVLTSLQQESLDPEASLPYLLHLLGVPSDADQFAHLSAEVRKARTFEAMRQLYLTSSQRQPLVIAVENLHWIDPTSEALLASLVERLAGAPILVLATCRPGYRAPWLDKSYATQIALQPLDLDESRQVVRSVMRDTVLIQALEEQLLARAEGNPFFLEELAYTLWEHGERQPLLAVPDTIQAVLAARMDRLPTPERQLLQTAAVLGKDVAVPLLQAIVALPEAALQHGLAHLQAAEFLYETQLWPERGYTFKHALTQAVAYGSLPQERRRALHARIVEPLEALAGERVAEQVERLAYHALRGEEWDKALAYCGQAGEKAMARSAHREAVGYCEQALSALSHMPETRDTRAQAIDLRLALRSALISSGDHGRT
jgi:predicted ATPase